MLGGVGVWRDDGGKCVWMEGKIGGKEERQERKRWRVVEREIGEKCVFWV